MERMTQHIDYPQPFQPFEYTLKKKKNMKKI